MVDVVYVAASKLDARYTRICIASVRHVYPNVPIRLLPGGELRRSLVDELRRYWNVGVADVPKGEYGWGFVKLEPLFGPRRERFLVLDSDTVIIGPVLDLASHHDEDFVVDDEIQSPAGAKAIYYDCETAANDGALLPNPAFLFNTGQWFGRSGILNRDDFGGLVGWDFPRRLTNPRLFKNGEQGILNFVVNQQWRAGRLRVARVPLLRWPGHGLRGVDAAAVAAGSCTPCVVHWAGMKKTRHRDMLGADLLTYFEGEYYDRLPAGRARKALASGRHVICEMTHAVHVKAAARFRAPSRLFRTAE